MPVNYLENNVCCQQDSLFPVLQDSIDTQIDSLPQALLYRDTAIYSNICDSISLADKSSEELIIERLGKIQMDGIGFSDIISVISFPLIIALFAFSLPFLFQTINHINDKYASKQISRMFGNSIIYKLFWIINTVSIVYVFAYGACTLLWKDYVLVVYLHILNWITISVAFIYALTVMMFVLHCVNFNNPDRLLKIIKQKFTFDKLVYWLKNKFVSIKKSLRILSHHKDRSGNLIYKRATNMVSGYNKQIPQENYVTRLIGIVSFAVKEIDYRLFQDALDNMDFIIEAEKKDFSTTMGGRQKDDIIREAAVHYRTMRFFDELLTTYTSFPNAYMQNEAIVFKMVGSFDKSKYMTYADSFKLAVCMRKMIDYGNFALLELYIDYTRYYFQYLRDLPKTFYIKGGLPEKIFDVEQKSNKSWNELCCFHYESLAYAYYIGNYSMLKTHIDKKHYSRYNLYPKTGADILIRYGHCVKDTWRLNDDGMYDRKIDVKSLLSRYTVALLMLIPEKVEMGYAITELITPDIIKTIEKSKDDLVKEVVFVKENSALLSLYPYIAHNDFECKYDYFLNIIKSVNMLPCGIEEKKTNNHCELNLFDHILDCLNGTSIVNNNKSKQMNLYEMGLNDELTNDFRSRFLQFQNDSTRYIPNGLFSNVNVESDNLVDELSVNPCQMIINKLCFIDEKYYDDGKYLFHEYSEQISNRLIYMSLSVFRKMRKKQVNVKSCDFDIFFEKFTRGRKEDYTLICIDSPFRINPNIQFVGRDEFYDNTVPFVNIDSAFMSQLTDLDDFSFFKGALLIVATNDLPAIVDIGEKENITVDYEDISDESKLQLSVRTTVDTHKKVIYNPKANIAVVRLKQMSM